MLQRIVLTAACGVVSSSAAFASTLTHTSDSLLVGSEGGNGATQVVISFTGNTPPARGKCVHTQKVAAYSDGAHTLDSLKSGEFGLTKTIMSDTGRVKMAYANVCLGNDGQTVTGQYQIYFIDSSGYGGDFFANNLAYDVPGDLVELDLYFGGEVLQTYSNLSSTQGAGVITP